MDPHPLPEIPAELAAALEEHHINEADPRRMWLIHTNCIAALNEGIIGVQQLLRMTAPQLRFFMYKDIIFSAIRAGQATIEPLCRLSWLVLRHIVSSGPDGSRSAFFDGHINMPELDHLNTKLLNLGKDINVILIEFIIHHPDTLITLISVDDQSLLQITHPVCLNAISTGMTTFDDLMAMTPDELDFVIANHVGGHPSLGA